MTKLKRLVQALEDIKLRDIIIYDMRTHSPFFDYFIISTASNTRQLDAAIRDVKKGMDELNEGHPRVEGSGGAWALIDAGDIVVNVFTESERTYYNIEKMWMDVPVIDLSEL